MLIFADKREFVFKRKKNLHIWLHFTKKYDAIWKSKSKSMVIDCYLEDDMEWLEYALVCKT